MSNTEAIHVICKIRACRYSEHCEMNCENCPSNYSDEELHEALGLAAKALEGEKNGENRNR